MACCMRGIVCQVKPKGWRYVCESLLDDGSMAFGPLLKHLFALGVLAKS